MLVVLYNLLAGNGTMGGTDYQENGDLGFTATVTPKINQTRLAIAQLNEMIKDPALVTDANLGVLTSVFDNPLIVEVDAYGYPFG